jgi:hypothetical protein
MYSRRRLTAFTVAAAVYLTASRADDLDAKFAALPKGKLVISDQRIQSSYANVSIDGSRVTYALQEKRPYSVAARLITHKKPKNIWDFQLMRLNSAPIR